jgi:hypothetical protein
MSNQDQGGQRPGGQGERPDQVGGDGKAPGQQQQGGQRSGGQGERPDQVGGLKPQQGQK